MKVADVLTMVRDFRTADAATPVVLMGYLNPILSYGPERFCADAAAAGVDGLIVVDLPTEEADLLLPHSNANGLDFIRLVAPTTDDERLPHVLNGSSGFVYYVSITGITGTRSATAEHLDAAIPRIRRATDLPIAIGFGVRSPEQAAQRVAGRRCGGGGLGADRYAVGASGRRRQGIAGGGGDGAGSGARAGGGGTKERCCRHLTERPYRADWGIGFHVMIVDHDRFPARRRRGSNRTKMSGQLAPWTAKRPGMTRPRCSPCGRG